MSNKRMASKTELETLEPEVELTHKSFGVALVPNKGWCAVEIKYDPVSGKAQVVEYHIAEAGKDHARELFRIKSALEVLV